MMGYIIKYIFSHESLYIICRICRSVEKVRILRSSTPSFYLFKTMYYNPVTTFVNSVSCCFKPQLLHKHYHFRCSPSVSGHSTANLLRKVWGTFSSFLPTTLFFNLLIEQVYEFLHLLFKIISFHLYNNLFFTSPKVVIIFLI